MFLKTQEACAALMAENVDLEGQIVASSDYRDKRSVTRMIVARWKNMVSTC